MYKKCEEILNKLESEGKIKISDYQFPPKQELKLKLKDMLEVSNFIIDNFDREIKVKDIKEYTNFYIVPRGSDGKLINGSYNRVWKTDKYVGALNLTKITEIGEIAQEKLKIRKLTPKECWQLMGFDDGDFEKAAKVNSNTQLYKQAGNSIVVNVLESIFKELIR